MAQAEAILPPYPRAKADLVADAIRLGGAPAGGFFTAGASAMLDLRERIHAELGRMRATGWRAPDEQILAALAGREPHAFERWYADYAGILANYVAIRRDVPTILDGLVYCHERGLWMMEADVARRLLDAIHDGHVELTPPQAERFARIIGA